MCLCVITYFSKTFYVMKKTQCQQLFLLVDDCFLSDAIFLFHSILQGSYSLFWPVFSSNVIIMCLQNSWSSQRRGTTWAGLYTLPLHALEGPRAQMLGNQNSWLQVACLKQSTWASSIIWQKKVFCNEGIYIIRTCSSGTPQCLLCFWCSQLFLSSKADYM